VVKQVEIKQDWGNSQKIEWEQHQAVTEGNITSGTEVAPNYEVRESTASIPTQLYRRLGLAMPRWLFWILSVSIGATLSGLLVSSLALWTPLWSTTERTDEELAWSGKTAEKAALPEDLWSNISQYKLTRPMNILLMGIEPVAGSVDGSPESFAGKSATMLLIRLNPENKSIRVLSIPKDTMISIPEKGLSKVADANSQGGQALALRTISRSLSNAPIDRYIRISTSGLQQLVNQLGGVDVFVPQVMQSEAGSKQVAINLVNGWQTLNGEQAEQFVRYRTPKIRDLERVQRQQVLFKALRERLSSPAVVPRLPQLIRVMRKYFDTDLKLSEMMALVNFSANVERDNFQMTILPGIFSRLSADPDSYWLDLTGQVDLLSNYAGVNIGGMQPTIKPLPSLKIAIQNAANESGLTQKVVNSFKQKGFAKVYPIADWSDIQHETQIIVQKGSRTQGEALQKTLGFGNVEVAATGDLESDITIRVGRDWK
jgi:polyisoprenyl-teichoic acid--peptidoglycan teichoic acid transferase